MINAEQRSFYSSKTPYQPPPSTMYLQSPPIGFELICTQLLARHGSRSLEGTKYDYLSKALWEKAKLEGSLTALGEQFGEDLENFIKINDIIGLIVKQH